MSAAALLPPLEPLLQQSRKRTRYVFSSTANEFSDDQKSAKLRLAVKLRDEYKDLYTLPPALLAQQGEVGPLRPQTHGQNLKPITAGPAQEIHTHSSVNNLALATTATQSTFSSRNSLSNALALHKQTRTVKPQFHPRWKLVRVVSGHLGWVRSLAIEPGNKWFASGAGDRVVKVWDLASGELKLSLTGHISTVRGLAVSPRHPYLFSCGEDKVCLRSIGSSLFSETISRLDGEMLGLGSKQSYKALSWTLIRGVLLVSAPNT
jgi:pleiotropic regulator 1